MKHRHIVIALFALPLLVIGCSDKQKVGQGLKKDFNGAINDLNTTTTVAAAGSGTTPVSVADLGNATTTTIPPTTAAPRATVTTAPPAPVTTAATIDRSVKVTINGDGSGKNQFDPNTIQAPIGAPVKFTNNDTKVRYVLSPDGGFRSPDIPPGGSWTYITNKTGTFQLKDGTRPYVTATLQVY